MVNLQGELLVMKTMGIRPNFTELGRTYNMDYRTIKKMYEGKPKKKVGRKNESFWDRYKSDIKELLKLKGITIKAVYKWLKMNKQEVATYQSFTAYVRKNKEHLETNIQKANVRFETAYGKQLQYDWKGPIVMHNIANETFKFYVFSATLGASRLHKFVYSKLITREDVQNSLIVTFKSIGGIPEECLTDNMTSIVNYKKHDFSDEFKGFAKDMGFIPKRCKPFSPETKGKVESSNRFIKWLYAYEGKFTDEDDLKRILNQINIEVNNEINQTTGMAPIMLFRKEKEYLKPLPKEQIMRYYEGAEVAAKVPNTLLVYYKGSGYSVPNKFIGKTVKLKVYDKNLYIYYNTDLISIHELSNKKFNYHESDYINSLRVSIKNPDVDIDKIAKENLSRLATIIK